MTDITKLADGSVDEVKAGLSGLSHDDLLKLRAAEAAGKNRSTAIEAIDDAIRTAEASRTGGRVAVAPAATHSTVAADFDDSGPANIEPATTFSTSGAPVQVVPDVDPSHPAVDNDPRAGTTAAQNRIDFNDPTISGAEAVSRALAGDRQA